MEPDFGKSNILQIQTQDSSAFFAFQKYSNDPIIRHYDFGANIIFNTYCPVEPDPGITEWTQSVESLYLSPKGLYHGIRGRFKLDSGR